MKIWVVVYNWGLINEDADVFKTYEGAKQAFKEYTGLEFDPNRKYKEISGYYEQCDIFEKILE
jgi:hypothetical protein